MTKEEMQEKGIKRADVLRVLKRQEKLCHYYASKYIQQGFVSPKEHTEWDNAVKNWDIYKVRLSAWDKTK